MRRTDRGQHPANDTPDRDRPDSPTDDTTATGAGLLLRLAWLYRDLLHAATECANFLIVDDPDLNAAYLWVLEEINQLLGPGRPFRTSCPIEFEPAVPDLLASTLANQDWSSFFARDADRLLSEVQRFGFRHIPASIPEHSPLGILLSLYEERLDTARRIAQRHREAVREEMTRLGFPVPKTIDRAPGAYRGDRGSNGASTQETTYEPRPAANEKLLGPSPSISAPARLNKNEAQILQVLGKAGDRLMTLADIQAARGSGNMDVIGKTVNRLISHGLAERPRGPRGGVTITEAGREWLRCNAGA